MNGDSSETATADLDHEVEPTVTASQTERIDGGTVPESEPLSKDVLFEILKNERRREALSFLRECGGQTTLSDMAEHIAAKENDITVQQLTSSQRKRVYIGLYQCHLPKMDSAGIVAFEKNRGTIELLPAAEQLNPFLVEEPTLDAASSADGTGTTASDVSLIALTVALAVGLATSGGVVGLPLLQAIPPAGWAMVSATTLIGLAVYQAYLERN
jgi:DNA-binding transcriptional ArsR family regulator